MRLIVQHQATVVVEPAEQAFALRSASEATQAAPILCFGSLASTPMRGNAFNDPVVPEALLQGITVIGPISDQVLGVASVKQVSRVPSTQRASWG